MTNHEAQLHMAHMALGEAPAGTPGKTTWYHMAVAGDTAEVSIDDFIGYYGISAKQFVDELKALKTPKINVRINSDGGSVVDACAMCTSLQEHPAEVTCHVDGIAASAASLVAIAGDKCLISPTGFLMIHNVMIGCYGNAAVLRQEADVCEKLSTKAADMYAAKTGQTRAAMQALMDAETWFTAEEAVAAGLADVVKTSVKSAKAPAAVLARVMSQYQKVPESLRRFAASIDNSPAPVRAIIKEQAMKIFFRDGKYFMKIGATEVEVPAPVTRDGKLLVTVGESEHEATLVSPPLPPPAPAALPVANASGGSLTNAVQIADEAVKKERQYRANFHTAMDMAKLSPEAAKTFEATFYGRPIEDVKYLASQAIGARAQPVGEGDAGTGDPAAAQTAKATADIAKHCAAKFASDASWRRRFGANTSDVESPAYKAALARYIAVETKCRADEAAPTRKDDDEPTGDDPITQLLKNKSVFTPMEATR